MVILISQYILLGQLNINFKNGSNENFKIFIPILNLEILKNIGTYNYIGEFLDSQEFLENFVEIAKLIKENLININIIETNNLEKEEILFTKKQKKIQKIIFLKLMIKNHLYIIVILFY